MLLAPRPGAFFIASHGDKEGPPPEPSAVGPVGRGGTAQRGNSAARGGAMDAQLVPTRVPTLRGAPPPIFFFKKENGPRPVQKKNFIRPGQP